MSRSASNKHASSASSSPFRDAVRKRMSRDLQLRGMADRTHDGYLREVRKLALLLQRTARAAVRATDRRVPALPDQ